MKEPPFPSSPPSPLDGEGGEEIQKEVTWEGTVKTAGKRVRMGEFSSGPRCGRS